MRPGALLGHLLRENTESNSNDAPMPSLVYLRRSSSLFVFHPDLSVPVRIMPRK